MKNFIYTIFISAFLLFQVQPMIARFILPWYGGSAAVWSTCMLFFQTGLLIGYGYAHLITKLFTIKNQVKIHLALLIISLIAIPVTPHEWMKPTGNENPIAGILTLLSLSVGFPYIMVSTTGPLLQFWFSISNPKKSPYRLYALSNLGSLIGLLSYPFVIEPYLNLKTQTWLWSGGYLLFILLCGLIANALWKMKVAPKIVAKKKPTTIEVTTKILWLLLPCIGTVTLLSFTNKLTQDIVVIPFLWVIPLSLYLVSFIIAFGNPKWYNRKFVLPVMLILIALIIKNQIQYVVYDKEMPLEIIVLIYCLGVFFICLALHGELARIKPDEGNLTLFYLLISLGGVVGGIFINIIVPFIFNGYWEIYIAFACSVILIAYLILNTDVKLKTGSKRPAFTISTVIVLGGILFSFWKEYGGFNKNVIGSSRNFYGVLKVIESNKNTTNWQRMLFHGDIMHGIELMDPGYMNRPIAYYGPESGIGLALSRFPTRSDVNYKGMKVGMIGLGTGTISAYGTDRDLYRYYELNPQVENMARTYFKYLGNYKGKTEVILGDGRISLENELKETGSEQFDVLGVDAFSGDAIPAHLLTHQAADLYMKHLKKDGILAFNITNKYLDLMQVMCGMSEHLKKPLYYFFQEASTSGPVNANWILFTDNSAFLNDPEVKKHIQPFDVNENTKVYWTDDYSAILPIFL